jgi:hypothetical protein
MLAKKIATLAKKLAALAKKLVALAKMKSAVFDQASAPIHLFSADEIMYYPSQAGRALCGQLEDDCMLENEYQFVARLDMWGESFIRKLGGG